MINTDDASWLDTWGPGVLGTVLSGVILYVLFVLTEKRADVRAELGRERAEASAEKELERRAADDRVARRLRAVSIFIRSMNDRSETYFRGPGPKIDGLRAFVIAVAAELTSLGIALMIDEPEFDRWVQAEARAAARATDPTDLSEDQQAELVERVDLIATEIVAWARDPKGYTLNSIF